MGTPSRAGRRSNRTPGGCVGAPSTCCTSTVGGVCWASIADFESFLDAAGIVEPDDAMPNGYREAVFRFIELHANWR